MCIDWGRGEEAENSDWNFMLLLSQCVLIFRIQFLFFTCSKCKLIIKHFAFMSFWKKKKNETFFFSFNLIMKSINFDTIILVFSHILIYLLIYYHRHNSSNNCLLLLCFCICFCVEFYWFFLNFWIFCFKLCDFRCF